MSLRRKVNFVYHCPLQLHNYDLRSKFIWSSLTSMLNAIFEFLGICAMCGKQVLDTKDYRQSST